MQPANPAAIPPKRPRDLRLDVFRGLCMLIIFIAHLPENPWLAWIPARFGFSSATELFVFGSGFASAVAFGRTFSTAGFWPGTLKIAKRIWQLYWAHLGLFVALAGITVLVAPPSSQAWMAIDYLIKAPADALAGLVTLTFVPMLLDILPLYIVVLALVPVMVAARQVHPVLPFALSAALYLATWMFGLAMPGRGDTGQPWFFNPFAWQALFFAGFAIGLGWWTPPRLGERRLVWLSAAIVVVSVPFNFWAITDAWPVLVDLQVWAFPLNTWTNLHPVRLIHFLALAYLTLSLLEHARFLLETRVAKVLTLVGTQSLPAFLACTALAWMGGIALDMVGHEAGPVALVNLAGLGGVVAAAWIAKLFKSEPWTKPKPARAPIVMPAPGQPQALER
ncbi:OpgC domain-containing protein [Phreatobacter aquaticus]|uniref:OpgC domain-containing protein n=1 Tax=Phreatobacter aquaticus TaxID=2570229 RepID=A0A4D7QP97_9HYPH|nr:OpgC domain-containing protein [Phreatobacter aquaticus]QCK86787.1 OpgC domain-containing protein [Phreatobacter aquaticus]